MRLGGLNELVGFGRRLETLILKVKEVAPSNPACPKDCIQPTFPGGNSGLPVTSGMFCSLQAVLLLCVGMSFPSQSVGGLLEHETCKEKGTHLLYRRWLWDSGLETGSKYLL